jgi:hypothetical protein
MQPQLESVSKQRLQHRPHYLFPGRVSVRLCSNVVTFRIGPFRTTGNLTRLDVKSVLDQEPQRKVFDSQPAARLRAQRHAASAGVQLDGRYLKSVLSLTAGRADRRDNRQQ